MIRNLRIKNFKLWEDTGDLKLAPITVLFGANSSGKSSIIQLLLLLKQTAESTDRKGLFNFSSTPQLVDLGSFGNIIRNWNFDIPFSFTVSWNAHDLFIPLNKGKKERIDSLTFQCIVDTKIVYDTEDNNSVPLSYLNPVLKDMAYYVDSYKYGLERIDESEYYIFKDFKTIKSKENGNKKFGFNYKFYIFPDELYSNFRNISFLSDFAFSFEKMMSSLQHIGPLREYPKRSYIWTGISPGNVGQKGERTIEALLASLMEETHEMVIDKVADWIKKMGLAKKFGFLNVLRNQYSVVFQTLDEKKDVNIIDVGFGISQILPVLVQAFYADKDSTVLLEQPEIHMHPKVQSDMADMFIEASKENNVQFIIESHSEYLLRRFQLRMAEGKLSPEDIKIYFCSNTEEGARIEELKTDEFGNISNWPKDFFGDRMGEIAARTKAEIKRKTGEDIDEENC